MGRRSGVLNKYSFGVGDRFAREGRAQLEAILKIGEQGIPVTPVWNKSFREHSIIGSTPDETRREADNAVQNTGFRGDYFVDADHINLDNVDFFIDSANYFTIDVADYIGNTVAKDEVDSFVNENESMTGSFLVPGVSDRFNISRRFLGNIAKRFLAAVSEVEKIYQYIAEQKRGRDFVTEISMDEVENPQSPVELLVILKMLADKKIPLQTIALKFSGRFNKGIDYVGDVERFTKEFEENLMVIDYAVQQYGLPDNLKLSIHTGSDKFSLYEPIRRMLQRHDKGIHVKTAGTTWLEELIGLALAGGNGLAMARQIYSQAFERFSELTAPYSTVLDIRESQLPAPEKVNNWTGQEFACSLRHQPEHPDFNPHFRQLLHCSYKIAAELDEQFTDALENYKDYIAPNVTKNIYQRHLKPLFYGITQYRGGQFDDQVKS